MEKKGKSDLLRGAEDEADGYPRTISNNEGPITSFFPKHEDSVFVGYGKVVNLALYASIALSAGRGMFLSALHTYQGGRIPFHAFKQGFSITFPLYFPFLTFGAISDHTYYLATKDDPSAKGRRRFEYDLP